MMGEYLNQTPEPAASQSEIETFQLFHYGPTHIGNLFAEVLTIPQELRQRVFYWPEEREFCEYISLIGRALDILSTAHWTLQGQFKVLCELRSSLLEAPTVFFVAPAYFCDKGLDSILHSIRKVQNDLKRLFTKLARLEAECSVRQEWSKRAFLEDRYPKGIASRNESTNRPDMKIKEQRVFLFAELHKRMEIVCQDGTGVLNLRRRPWLPGEPSRLPQLDMDGNCTITGNNEAVVGPGQEPSVDVHNVDVNPQEAAKDSPASPFPLPRALSRLPVAEREPEGSDSFEVPPSQNVENESQGSGSHRTPFPQIGSGRGNSRAFMRRPIQRKGISPVGTPVEKSAEVPETPEASRIGAVVMTQTSSPRRRKPSQSSGTSDATENANHMQNVVRTL